MIQKTKWFERKFTFDFPVGLLPCIIERLRGTPARLEEITKSLSKEILTKKDGDKWSIQEQVGHLLDLDELHEGRLEDYRNNLPVLRPADLQNKKTYKANHNERNIGDILSEFRSFRMNFVKLLEQVDEKDASKIAEHPRLKQKMRLVDMAFFVAEHDDHHIASIRELMEN